MPRYRRVSAPGMPFHLTARIQNREPLFVGLEGQVVRCIEESAADAHVQVVAYAVMGNHLHLIVLQGARPLGAYMQALLRRVALTVNRHRDRTGHLFERRYYSALCGDPDYFRTALAYVHLNPVRAGICEAPEQYEWTSHRLFCRLLREPARTPLELGMEKALRVFGSRDSVELRHCMVEYRDFLRWRIEADAAACEDPPPAVLEGPTCFAGDDYWYAELVPAAIRQYVPIKGARRPDLSELALRTLYHAAPGMPLDFLRSGGRSRKLVEVRQAVIVRALNEDYRPHQIARYLRISSSSVSRAGAVLRRYP